MLIFAFGRPRTSQAPDPRGIGLARSEVNSGGHASSLSRFPLPFPARQCPRARNGSLSLKPWEDNIYTYCCHACYLATTDRRWRSPA